MSQQDRDKNDNNKSPEDITDDAIIEWLSREPQRPASQAFRDKVMQDIRRRQPNVHRKAFCPSTHQSRFRAALARICPSPPAAAAIALLLGFVAGFVTAVAIGSQGPRSGPVAADRTDHSALDRHPYPSLAGAGFHLPCHRPPMV